MGDISDGDPMGGSVQGSDKEWRAILEAKPPRYPLYADDFTPITINTTTTTYAGTYTADVFRVEYPGGWV
jgi:hypothetical protein